MYMGNIFFYWTGCRSSTGFGLKFNFTGRFWQLATTKSTFKPGFEHGPIRGVQKWSQMQRGCTFTYPTLGWKCLQTMQKGPSTTTIFRRRKNRLYGTTTKSTFKPIFEQVSIRRVQNRSQKQKMYMFTYPNLALKCLRPSGKKMKIGAGCIQLQIWKSKHAPTLLLTPVLNASDRELLRTGFKISSCIGNLPNWASKIKF